MRLIFSEIGKQRRKKLINNICAKIQTSLGKSVFGYYENDKVVSIFIK